MQGSPGRALYLSSSASTPALVLLASDRIIRQFNRLKAYSVVVLSLKTNNLHLGRHHLFTLLEHLLDDLLNDLLLITINGLLSHLALD